MANWDKIRAARTDLTDYVVHLTRFVVELANGTNDVQAGFSRLKQIIKTGYLLPSRALRTTVMKNRNHTVKGDPAVCFTEQPLEQIPATLRHVDGATYKGYGIAFHKVDLYAYGGRPVIYGDKSVFNCLPDELQYLWVHYRPIRVGESGYPNDFTFERKWRSRVADKDSTPWEYDLGGLPLLLPQDFRRVAKEGPADHWKLKENPFPYLRIIVAKDSEVYELRRFIGTLKITPETESYHRVYYEALQSTQIISLERVSRKLKEGDDAFRKIETLPSPKDRQNIVQPVPRGVYAKLMRG